MTSSFNAASVAPTPAEQLRARRLPELLRFSSGEQVEQAAQWPARRAEIMEVFEREMFGHSPLIAPGNVRFEVTKLDPGALSRGKGGETIAQINAGFPHWLGANYRKYNGREGELPFDQHWLLATLAPRPLYVVSAQDDAWADPQAEFLGALAASLAWELLGQRGLNSHNWPQTDVPLAQNRVGYHRRSGGHGLTAYDWERVMDFADRQWAKQPNVAQREEKSRI